MKHYVIKSIVTIIFCLSFFCLFAETDNIISQIIFSSVSIAVCGISGRILFKMEYPNE